MIPEEEELTDPVEDPEEEEDGESTEQEELFATPYC